MNFIRPLILASSSPRRQFLLKEIGLSVRVAPSHADESFPADMPVYTVPALLARRKAESLPIAHDQEIIIAADTVVILSDEILNKPADRDEAVHMLSRLSGNTHTVVTAVYLRAREKSVHFEDHSRVTFRKLAIAEIESYVDRFRPLDKAGAYGAQECWPQGKNPCSEEEINFLQSIDRTSLIEKSIEGSEPAMVAIERIEGSYFNVMGLPVHHVWNHLRDFHE